MNEDDTQARIDEFMKRYEGLTKEMGVDFANYPMYVPDENGGFKVIIQSTPIDTRNRPVKSPFVPQ